MIGLKKTYSLNNLFLTHFLFIIFINNDLCDAFGGGSGGNEASVAAGVITNSNGAIIGEDYQVWIWWGFLLLFITVPY